MPCPKTNWPYWPHEHTITFTNSQEAADFIQLMDYVKLRHPWERVQDLANKLKTNLYEEVKNALP